MQIPVLSTEQMVEVDRLMVEKYGIQLIQMMENAGRNLAELSRRMVTGSVRSKRIAVLCGVGNNGGGGMVAARHLHNWGADVYVKVVGSPERIKDVPAQQFRILGAMGITSREMIELSSAELIVDAMIGYGLSGDPRGLIADWIAQVNASGSLVLALDTPSGLDTSSGIPGNPCIRATATLTLALPKKGLMAPSARVYVGELYLADIGVPPELYTKFGYYISSIFQLDTIVKFYG